MNTNPPDPELLSAYADGEVSESERAQVEQWLAQNPRGRHAVARVHVLASALRSLLRLRLLLDPRPHHRPLQTGAAGDGGGCRHWLRAWPWAFPCWRGG